jgi:hypothetical protein
VLADENGWFVGAIEAWPPTEVWSLLSPDLDARMPGSKAHLFSASLMVSPPKQYPRGACPLSDRARVEVIDERSKRSLGEVEVLTVPIERAGHVLAVAREAAARMGGAGFDVLVGRTRRLWQVTNVSGTAPLIVAGAIAAQWQAPILPPQCDRLFGIKGAREELERMQRDATSDDV